jgi:tRNA nucleotidyltransferase/poly(A) polymerase
MEIPKQVQFVIKGLENKGFEAYIVGGCVRDFLRENPPAGGPEDWDITTNAKPDEIVKIFPDSYLDNDFGTVRIASKDEKFKAIEITPFRIESKYTDKRRPDKIEWAKDIEQDLGRRDFTVNAMAAKMKNEKRKMKNEKEISNSNLILIDLFNGQF